MTSSQPRLNDINDHGLAVGLGYVPDPLGAYQTALFWSDATGLIDANSLLRPDSGWTLVSASEINEGGKFTGFGMFNGQLMAYRPDPVPEPSTWALMGLGAAGLWFLRRRNRNI